MNKKWTKIFLAYLLLLIGLSALAYFHRIPPIVSQIPHYDTIGHFLLMGFASPLINRALNRKKIRWSKLSVPLGPAILVALIAADEIAQRWSPYRTSDPIDFLADMTGIIIFYQADKWLSATGKKIAK